MYPLFPPGTQSISYCLLVETNAGLLLVDSGFGVQDYTQPTMFTRLFMLSLGMPRAIEETAISQVMKLGYSNDDVKHIVVTHLHSDHAGGLRDFPNAQVHVHVLEYEAVQSPQGFKERFYDASQWAHGPRWVVHDEQESGDWFGFKNSKVQDGLIPDIRLIPLHGHTRGHCGVAIQTATGWLLHCGDATYPFYIANEPAEPFKPLPFYVMSPPKWLEKSLIGENTAQLMELHTKHAEDIQLICSNDVITYSRQLRQQ
jgi:glyoxylase-like metal-dependent hydrolase (beta-lactamase superfamily II)